MAYLGAAPMVISRSLSEAMHALIPLLVGSVTALVHNRCALSERQMNDEFADGFPSFGDDI